MLRDVIQLTINNGQIKTAMVSIILEYKASDDDLGITPGHSGVVIRNPMTGKLELDPKHGIMDRKYQSQEIIDGYFHYEPTEDQLYKPPKKTQINLDQYVCGSTIIKSTVVL